MSRPPEFELAMDLIPDDMTVKIVRDYVMSLEAALEKRKDEIMRELGPSVFLRMDHLEAENAYLVDQNEEYEKRLEDAEDRAKAAAWAMNELKMFREAEGRCG